MALRPIKTVNDYTYDLNFPKKVPMIQKDGSGEKITLKAIYLTRDMEFAELIDDRALIIGFKYSQFLNYNIEAVNAQNKITSINVSTDGHNTKYLDQIDVQAAAGMSFAELNLSKE